MFNIQCLLWLSNSLPPSLSPSAVTESYIMERTTVSPNISLTLNDTRGVS